MVLLWLQYVTILAVSRQVVWLPPPVGRREAAETDALPGTLAAAHLGSTHPDP